MVAVSSSSDGPSIIIYISRGIMVVVSSSSGLSILYIYTSQGIMVVVVLLLRDLLYINQKIVWWLFLLVVMTFYPPMVLPCMTGTSRKRCGMLVVQ